MPLQPADQPLVYPVAAPPASMILTFWNRLKSLMTKLRPHLEPMVALIDGVRRDQTRQRLTGCDLVPGARSPVERGI
jgi:hypothetical protein